MKRSTDTSPSFSTLPEGSDTPLSPSTSSTATDYPIKRFKTFKACTLCRHNKTRCESGEEFRDGSNACRRCRHFSKRCSLEDNPIIPVINNVSASQIPSKFASSSIVAVAWKKSSNPGNTNHSTMSLVDDYATSITKSFDQYIARSPFQDPIRQKSAQRAFSPLVRARRDIDGGLEWGRALDDLRAIPGTPPHQGPCLHPPTRPPSISDLNITFRALYAPWIHWDLPIAECATGSPTFLQAVQRALVTERCCSASESPIHPQVQLDIQAGLYRTMIGGTKDTDDLRALHILSLYISTASALSITSSENAAGAEHGNELMMATALKLANTMHLEKDIQVVINFRCSTPSSLSHTSAPPNVIESLAKCRLLYSLYITSSFMQMIKGRKPNVSGTELFQQVHLVFGSPHVLSSTPQGIADARLVFLSRLCDIATRAFEVAGTEAFTKFHAGMKDSAAELESWRMEFVPFAAITDYHAAQENQHIFLHFHYCKMAIMTRVVLAVIRDNFTKNRTDRITHESLPPPMIPIHVARSWISETVAATEALVVAALSLFPLNAPQSSTQSRSLHPLASAPDYILSMIAFSALALAKTQIEENRSPERTHTPAAFRARDQTRRTLLDRLMWLFKQIGSEGSDLAGRYAAAFEVFLGILDEDRPADFDSGASYEGTFVSEKGSPVQTPPSPELPFGGAGSCPPPAQNPLVFGGSDHTPTPPFDDSFLSMFSYDLESDARAVWGDGDQGGLLDLSLFDLQSVINPSLATNF